MAQIYTVELTALSLRVSSGKAQIRERSRMVQPFSYVAATRVRYSATLANAIAKKNASRLSQLSTAVLLPDSRWAPRLKVGTFYYGCFQKYRENILHLEVSVVNN